MNEKVEFFNKQIEKNAQELVQMKKILQDSSNL